MGTLCLLQTGMEQAPGRAVHSGSGKATDHRWRWESGFSWTLCQIWHVHHARHRPEQGSSCGNCAGMYTDNIDALLPTLS